MKPLSIFLNRVIHADCTKLLPLFPNECIDFVCTDPPYLVNYLPRDGRRCPGDNTDDWLEPAFREIYRVLKPDSFCATFYGWPGIDQFMKVWKQSGFRPVSHLAWTKQHCSRDGYTRSFHEVGFLLAKGRPKLHTPAPPDVLPWNYTGNRLHTNEKPVAAIAPLIEAFSLPGDIVLDPFAGSGTTGVAAAQQGRRYLLVDKSWQHCRTARRRLATIPF